MKAQNQKLFQKIIACMMILAIPTIIFDGIILSTLVQMVTYEALLSNDHHIAWGLMISENPAFIAIGAVLFLLMVSLGIWGTILHNKIKTTSI